MGRAEGNEEKSEIIKTFISAIKDLCSETNDDLKSSVNEIESLLLPLSELSADVDISKVNKLS